MLSTSILILSIFITYSTPAQVIWSPNRSFSLSSSFKDGVVPCSNKDVLFPESVEESVLMESTIAVSELLLPSDGNIVFADGATLLFGKDSTDINCTTGQAVYKDEFIFSWSDPNAWNSTRFNKATPDAERLPCFDDIVLFPTTAQFTMSLPDFTQYVSGLTVGGRNLTTDAFINLINSPVQSDAIQQFIFGLQENHNPVVVKPEPCKSTSGCPCQTKGLHINCNLKYCSPPKCQYPIKPVGHCCEICGGSLLFEIDNFSMKAFKKLVKEIINSYGAEDFDYHIGMLPLIDFDTLNVMLKRVQVIVVEKGEYTGASAEVINEISYQSSAEWIKNEKLVQMSGSPDSETGMGAKIAGSMFFVVVIAMAILFGYYYRRSRFRIPDLRSGLSMGTGVLSRFQRRSDSVVTLTRRDSNISGVGTTAFRNPLYDSKRGRVTVTETQLEE